MEDLSPHARAGRLVGGDINLESILAGVAGACNHHVVQPAPVFQDQPAIGEPVVLDRAQIRVGQLGQRRRGLRPLNRELRVVVAVIADVDARHRANLLAYPRHIFLARACVDDD